MRNLMVSEIDQLILTLNVIREDVGILSCIERIAQRCIVALQNNKKILFAGNGGSAADSQHLAAELVSRLQYDRPGLAAIALTTDTSALTSIGNDYGFDHIFSRQLDSLAQEGDVLIAISTSGKSPNILRALKKAREKHVITIGFTGNAETNPMNDHCDELLRIPSGFTQKIQECHITIGHVICSLIEEALYGSEYNPLRKKIEALA